MNWQKVDVWRLTEWYLEEKEILKEKEAIETKEGYKEGDSTSINVKEGIYPVSYFDLNKYTTHWKLVIISIIS